MELKLEELQPGTPVEIPQEFRQEAGQAVFGLYKGFYGSYINNGSGQPLIDALFPAGLEERVFHYTAVASKWKTVEGPQAKSIMEVAREKYRKNLHTLPRLGMVTGGDPEIFLVHGDGSLFHAWEFLPKKSPDKQIYWDGAQAEFNPLARACLIEYMGQLRTQLYNLLGMARKVDSKATLSLQNVMKLSPKVLKETADEFLLFGCSPSENVYKDFGAPLDPKTYPFRACGGHIHSGLNGVWDPKQAPDAVMACDAITGIAGVALAEDIDDPERRRTYGKAGEYRLPKHGLEYRVLSNFWLCHPAIMHLVHEMHRQAIRIGNSGLFQILWDTPMDEVRQVINTCDVKGARKIIKHNQVLFQQVLWNGNFTNKDLAAKAGLRALGRGILGTLKKPYDIEGNWELPGYAQSIPWQNGDNTWSNFIQKHARSVGA